MEKEETTWEGGSGVACVREGVLVLHLSLVHFIYQNNNRNCEQCWEGQQMLTTLNSNASSLCFVCWCVVSVLIVTVVYREVLAEAPKQKLGKEKEVVNLVKFGNVLDWFGPFEKDENDLDFLDRLEVSFFSPL